MSTAENTADETREEELLDVENDGSVKNTNGEGNEENLAGIRNEIKQEFQQVQLADVDECALDGVFSLDGDDMDLTSSTIDTVDEADAQQQNETEPPTLTKTEKLDDSDEELEFTYTSSTDFQPHQQNDGYFIKLNDLLTDYFPFKLNVIIKFAVFYDLSADFD